MDQVERRMKKLMKELNQEGFDAKDYYYSSVISGKKCCNLKVFLNGGSAIRFGVKLMFREVITNTDIVIDKKIDLKKLNMKDYVYYDDSQDNLHKRHVIHLKDAKIKYIDIENFGFGYKLVHKSQLYKIFAIYKKLFIFINDCYLRAIMLEKDLSFIVSTSLYRDNLYNLYKYMRYLDRNSEKYKKLLQHFVDERSDC